VNWATDRTGTGADQLPRPMGAWLKSAREKWEVKRKVKERKGASGEREVVWGDEEGLFVLETSEIDGRGEVVNSMAEATREDRGEDKEKEEEGDGMVRLFEFDD
jgi:hypothetical protein